MVAASHTDGASRIIARMRNDRTTGQTVKPILGRGKGRRMVRAAIAVALLLLTAVILTNRLPPPADGRARRCEIPAERPRVLDLGRFADRAHLRAEAATAESWAIAYADVSPLRQQGARQFDEARDQCMRMLFAMISQRHSMDVGTVRAYAQQRNVIFDAAVLLMFAFAYVIAAYQIVGAVIRQWASEGRLALVVAIIVVSAVTAFLAILAGDLWFIAVEGFRFGNGHLSYRTQRLPWLRHRAIFSALELGVFWLVAVARIKARNGHTVERRTMFGIRDERS